jgi:hypothetical protein
LSIVLATCPTKIKLSATSACFFFCVLCVKNLFSVHAKTAMDRGDRKEFNPTIPFVILKISCHVKFEPLRDLCVFFLSALCVKNLFSVHAKTAKNRGARKEFNPTIPFVVLKISCHVKFEPLRDLCVFFLSALCVKNLFSVHAKVMRHLNTNFYFGCVVFSKYSRNNYLHT